MINKYLPPEIAEWATRHLKVRIDPTVPTACVSLSERGYTLSLGRLWNTLEGNDAARTELLLHELAHVFRGDCLARPAHPQLWNVATDSIINNTIPMKHLDEICPGIVWKYREDAPHAEVLSEALEQQMGVMLPSAKFVYELLCDRAEQLQNMTLGLQDVSPAEGDLDKAMKEHAKAVLSAPAELRKQFGMDIKAPKSYTVPKPIADPVLLVKLRQVLRRIIARKDGDTKERTRTWLREGRIPMLPGRARVPRLRVALLIDISGSMTNVLLRILGIATWANREVEARVGVWADTGAWMRGSTPPAVGGGTNIRAAFDLMKSWKADVTLIITDGYIEPGVVRDEVLKCHRVLWCMAGTYTLQHLPLGPLDEVVPLTDSQEDKDED